MSRAQERLDIDLAQLSWSTNSGISYTKLEIAEILGLAFFSAENLCLAFFSVI